ncbi:cell wall-binding repeat-containing protein [Euzebya rosea]|uniref:DUF7933 domain-containing protein n=1 Tax=Euzebya rosea TaxID=2052804 RepID=UPI0014758C93|nr:cell wall-binding repeat-containing protein [Euzebya rosea]
MRSIRHLLLVTVLAAAMLALPAAPVSAQEPYSLDLAFAPSTIGPTSTTRATWTLTNNTTGPVDPVGFVSILDPDVTVQDPASATTTCAQATVTALPGSSQVELSDAKLGAGQFCRVTVDVTASVVDTHFNDPGFVTTGNNGPPLFAGEVGTVPLTVDGGVPGITKSFSPLGRVMDRGLAPGYQQGDDIVLTITFDNSRNGAVESNLFVTDPLPAGLVVADQSNAFTNCNAGPFQFASVDAVPGSSSVSLLNGAVDVESSCVVEVVLTATRPMDAVNRTDQAGSGDIGFAVAAISVEALDFRKAFLDGVVAPGGVTTVEFTIDNRTGSQLADGTFTDDLDAMRTGTTIAGGLPTDPCGLGSTLSFAGGVLELADASLAAGASCTFEVAVQLPGGELVGQVLTNTTSDFTAMGTSDPGGGGDGRPGEDGPVVIPAASDDIVVRYLPIASKEFVDDPVGPGDQVTLEFTLENPDSTTAMTDVSFTDLLTDIFAFPVTVDLPTDPCGPSSEITLVFPATETQALAFSDDSLEPSQVCTFQVVITVGDSIAGGLYTNTVSDLTATVAGALVNTRAFSDDLLVVGAPSVRLAVTNNPVPAGGTATVELEIIADDSSGTANDIAFDIQLPGDVTVGAGGLPADICGGANGTLTFLAPDIVLDGVSLDPGESCVITLDLTVDAGANPSLYTVQTTVPTATVDGVAVEGVPAADDIDVPGIVLTKDFTDDPALPGGETTLEFTLENVTSGTDYDEILFTDSVSAAVSGATITSADQAACGGTAQTIGGNFLFFSGGAVPAGGTCSFSVSMAVPAGTADGDYRNTTSSVSYQNPANDALVGMPATDVLIVDKTLIDATKAFLDFPVRAGDLVDLEFTLTNTSDTLTIDEVGFTDDLTAVLPGLEAIGLPAADVCGAGSQATGTDVITVTGGTLAPGAGCTFSVTLQVPASAAAGGTFPNQTSIVTGETVGDDLAVVGDPAMDDLLVSSEVAFDKAFSGPVVPGGTVTLQFSIANDNPSAVAALRFTDDLEAVLPGLAPTGALPTAPCGPGSSVAFAGGLLTLDDGSVPDGELCTFGVTLLVPATAAPGTYSNVTSDLQSGGIPVAMPAEADLAVEPPPLFTKAFAPNPIGQGDATTATYTIDNTVSLLDATGLDFTDTLPAGLSVADPANASTTCTGGTFTAVAGSTTIAYTGGTVNAGDMCTIMVDISGDVGGVYVDETGELTSSSGNSGTATDTLVVRIPPTLNKDFLADTITLGGTTTLILTLDNTANGAAVEILDLTDTLPAGMTIASPASAISTCIGGTLSAPDGGSTITFGGGDVPGTGTCQVEVDVTTDAVGTLTNTTDPLVTANGVEAGASADLTTQSAPVTPPATVADLSIEASARPIVVVPGSSSAVTFTITNEGPNTSTGVVEYTIPDGVTVNDVIGCTEPPVEQVCALPTLRAGRSVEVTLLTTHAEEGTDTFSATVVGNNDPIGDNDTASIDVFVRQAEGLSADLIQAAIEMSRERFGSAGGFAQDTDAAHTASHVVLARVDVFADALAGSVLTGDAPLLFTQGAILDNDVAQEIRRVLPAGGTVYLLGGEAALSATVHDAVEAYGFQVVRLAGPSRVETALAVADEARSLYGGTDVGIARAFGTEDNETAAWADSVTGGGWAADTGTPIVLTPTASLHPAVAEWVEANAPTERVVLGGTAAISDAVATAVNATERVPGDERAGTAVAIARQLRGVEPEGSRAYLLINGFADDGWGYGMIAAGLSADSGAPVLVTQIDTAPPATETELDSCAQEPVSLRRVAPPAQLSDALLSLLDNLDTEDCPGQTGGGDGDGGGGGAQPSDQDIP